jgi:cysteinyl-tRNA synthetase
MSKSLGNFFTVRDLLARGVPGEVIRLVFLSTHYRKPMDWTDAKAQQAEATLRKWRALTEGVPPGDVHPEVERALADDLNTPRALAGLHRLANEGDGAALRASAEVMGLLTDDLGDWVEAGPASGADMTFLVELRDRLGAAREAARASGDFAEVDRLKAALTEAGVEVRMSKTGIELVPGAGFSSDRLWALAGGAEAGQ